MVTVTGFLCHSNRFTSVLPGRDVSKVDVRSHQNSESAFTSLWRTTTKSGHLQRLIGLNKILNTPVSVCAEEPLPFTLQCNTRTCFSCVCSQLFIVVHTLKIWSRSGARRSTQPVSRTWQTNHTHTVTYICAATLNKVLGSACHYLVVHLGESFVFLREVDELKKDGQIVFMISFAKRHELDKSRLL